LDTLVIPPRSARVVGKITSPFDNLNTKVTTDCFNAVFKLRQVICVFLKFELRIAIECHAQSSTSRAALNRDTSCEQIFLNNLNSCLIASPKKTTNALHLSGCMTVEAWV
jgi:hypothetical protein